VTTISPTAQWDSRTIASEIWDSYSVDFRKFGTYKVSYKDPASGSTKLVSEGMGREDDDSMMIDDDFSAPQVLWPSHALDLLHMQAVAPH
jgi:hypothetical protein